MESGPTVLRQILVPGGRWEMVEWRWPPMLTFSRTETALMIEMSVPPYATDAAADFPRIAEGQFCFMGTLFVRYPGILLRGRSEGGKRRVVRGVFSPEAATRLIGGRAPPPLALLQSLLNIRNDTLRALMRMADRELTVAPTGSPAVGDALLTLAGTELSRMLDRHEASSVTGRLANWQYARIRERLASVEAPPTVAELATLCGISSRHLHRQFLALTGKTVASYVASYWLERAKAMLAERTLPIKAVAAACGFSHANSFARAFQRRAGVAPSEFRRLGPGR